MILGLNKGFADLTSYTLTGIPAILEQAYDEHEFAKNSQNVDPDSIKVFLKERTFSEINFTAGTMSKCHHQHYCFGILFANAFYKTQLALSLDPANKIDRIKSYKLIVEAWKASWKNMKDLVRVETIKRGNLDQSVILLIALNSLVKNITDDKSKLEFTRQLNLNFN